MKNSVLFNTKGFLFKNVEKRPEAAAVAPESHEKAPLTLEAITEDLKDLRDAFMAVDKARVKGHYGQYDGTEAFGEDAYGNEIDDPQMEQLYKSTATLYTYVMKRLKEYLDENGVLQGEAIELFKQIMIKFEQFHTPSDQDDAEYLHGEPGDASFDENFKERTIPIGLRKYIMEYGDEELFFGFNLMTGRKGLGPSFQLEGAKEEQSLKKVRKFAKRLSDALDSDYDVQLLLYSNHVPVIVIKDRMGLRNTPYADTSRFILDLFYGGIGDKSLIVAEFDSSYMGKIDKGSFVIDPESPKSVQAVADLLNPYISPFRRGLRDLPGDL